MSQTLDQLQPKAAAPAPPGVLYLLNTWVVGGTETQLVTLLRHLDRSRYAPHVCALYDDERLGPAMAGLGVPAFSLGIRRVRYPDTLLRLARLAGYCRRHNVRVIQGLRTDQLAVVAGRMAGVPVVIGAQRDIFWGGSSRWRLLRGQLDRLLSGVIANSRAAADYRRGYSRVAPDRLFIVPNGVELDPPAEERAPASTRAALGIPPEAPLLAILGRLNLEVKGHPYLLKAMRAPALAGCHLLVIGDGAGRAELERLIDAEGLRGRVHLAGHRSDGRRYLALADVAVVASTHESSPNVVLEAWAAQRPVVATRVGGVPELVAHGVNGLLVPPADPPALAAALGSLLADPGRRRELAAAGHELVLREYAAPAMAARTVALYDQLLHEAAQ